MFLCKGVYADFLDLLSRGRKFVHTGLQDEGWLLLWCSYDRCYYIIQLNQITLMLYKLFVEEMKNMSFIWAYLSFDNVSIISYLSSKFNKKLKFVFLNMPRVLCNF